MTKISHSKKGGKTPKKPKSKTDKLRIHLLSGKSISGKQALKLYGLYRLSSAIFNLRKEGHPINTIPVVENGERFAKYKLAIPPMKYSPK